MINSVIVGIVVFFLIEIEFAFLYNDEEREKIDYVTSQDLLTGVIMGILVGCINYYTVKAPFMAPIFLITMIALMGLLIAWWKKEGATLLEFIPMVLLAIIFFFIAKSAAFTSASTIESPFWSSVVVFIPTAMLIGTTGFFISDYFLFRGELDEEDGVSAALGWGTAVLTAIIIFFLAISQIAWGEIGGARIGYTDASGDASLSSEDFVYTDDTDEYAPAKTDSDEWYGFYNLSLQDDEDSSNDYNFGYGPEEGWDAEWYDETLRERMKLDPALTAADTAWLDANVGTRYLGEFYESCKGDWAKTINLAKIRFMADQSAYYKNLDAFFAFLDSADEVKVEYRDSGLDDQMYMNPFTADGVPDVIVMETPDHDGWFLVYTFVIKGTPIDVAYRIDCGYQPTNVEEVMHIKPEPKPQPEKEKETKAKAKKKSSPKPTKSTPEPTKSKPEPTKSKPEHETTKPTVPETTKPTVPETTKPTEPETTKPTEPEKPHPKKDKSKGTKGDVVKPNDDPGPGEDTNNGKGAKTSKKDQDTNSNHYSSYDEYTKAEKELEKVNKEQKKGGDDNTPSTPKPKKDTKVDSNADKDKGNGNIDTPTPTKAPAKKADDDKPITTEPAGQWDGPAD